MPYIGKISRAVFPKHAGRAHPDEDRAAGFSQILECLLYALLKVFGPGLVHKALKLRSAVVLQRVPLALQMFSVFELELTVSVRPAFPAEAQDRGRGDMGHGSQLLDRHPADPAPVSSNTSPPT